MAALPKGLAPKRLIDKINSHDALVTDAETAADAAADSASDASDSADAAAASASAASDIVGTLTTALESYVGFTEVPGTTSSGGAVGQIAVASGFIYVCVAPDTWKRAALSTW